MAFRPGGGIDPTTPPTTTPIGTGGGGNTPRTTFVSPFVPVRTTVNDRGGTTTHTPLLPPEAGLFGGRLPPSRKGTEKREQILMDAKRAETFHPNTRALGPFVLAEQGTGAVPIERMPAHAAEVFAAMARGDLK